MAFSLSGNPEYHAVRVLSECDINSIPVDLHKILTMYDISLEEVKLSPHCSGIAIPALDSVILNSQAKYLDSNRKRFTLAHEIGHILMDHGKDAIYISSDDPVAKFIAKEKDQEADQFASSLLMPKAHILEFIKDKTPSMDLICGISDFFQVSLSSSAFRYIDCCSQMAMVVFSKSSVVSAFRLSASLFGELSEKRLVLINKGMQLVKGSLAEAFFADPKFRNTGKNDVDLSAWFPGLYSREYKCNEQILASPHSGWVLSLVCLNVVGVGPLNLPEDFIL